MASVSTGPPSEVNLIHLAAGGAPVIFVNTKSFYGLLARNRHVTLYPNSAYGENPVLNGYRADMLSSQMNEALRFKLLWKDKDMLELRISGWNGRFGGTVDVYVARDGLGEAAATLEGFPAHSNDQRELVFGPAKGTVKMRLFCEGAAGRSFVELSLESEHDAYECAMGVSAERVCFHAPIEATAVDTFVSGLRTMQQNLSGVAQLNLLVQR